MTIRLIASDLDGTLFAPDHLVAPRTVEAVNAAFDAGFIMVAATGRSYFGGAQRAQSTGARLHWFIGSNGAHRFNLQTNELEERLLFSADQVDAMASALRSAYPGIGLGFEHESGFTYDDAFLAISPDAYDGGPRRNTAEWAADDIGKVFVRHGDMTYHELVAAASALVPDQTHVTSSGTDLVELTPPGGNKGQGLARLCAQLDIDASEVVAFGDNNNDIEMLKWAGRGIAMANATDQARSAADEVTASNAEFGVAKVIESLL